jgi:hypothetical protein
LYIAITDSDDKSILVFLILTDRTPLSQS